LGGVSDSLTSVPMCVRHALIARLICTFPERVGHNALCVEVGKDFWAECVDDFCNFGR
jgi:hypothetical protein